MTPEVAVLAQDEAKAREERARAYFNSDPSEGVSPDVRTPSDVRAQSVVRDPSDIRTPAEETDGSDDSADSEAETGP